MLQVYTWEPNSNSGKPLFALSEKGVEFEYHYIDMLKFEQHTPEYLARNPAGTLPTMVHNGKIFTESTQICEYLENVFPQNSYVPKDPHERYLMRWWAGHGAAWAGALSVLGWSRIGRGPQRSQEEKDAIIARIPTKERQIAWSRAMNATFTEQQLADARQGVINGILMMNKRLSETRGYFAGATYSIADLCIFANAYRVHVQFGDVANDKTTPYYMDWLRKIYSRPATPKAFSYSRGMIGQSIPQVMKDLGLTPPIMTPPSAAN